MSSKQNSPPIDDEAAPPPGYDAATAAGSSAVRREQRQANLLAEQSESASGAVSDVGRDERPLPEGWIKLWNSVHQHFYYVDTTATPARSIWTHPLDDSVFLKANPQFRDIAQGSAAKRLSEEAGRASSDSQMGPTFSPPAHEPPSNIEPTRGANMTHKQRIQAAGEAAAERARQDPEPRGLKKFSRNLKDSTTKSDHVERRRQEAEKAEAQKIAREDRRAAAQAFIRAAQTGHPQFIGTDERTGTQYFADPPAQGVPIQMVLGQFPPPYGFESRRDGPTIYMRPACPPMYATRGMYGGGYGRGMYGGGMGMPIMGGLLGGALLGGMLF